MSESQNETGRLTISEMVYNIVIELIDTETLVVVSLTVIALFMLSKVLGNTAHAGELLKYFGAPLGLIIGAFAGFVKGLRKGVRVGENKAEKK